MFKKLLIASAVLTVSSVAFANHHSYKGDYKGEAPCPTYQFQAGPYLGVSLGDRTNYSGSPTVYKGLEGTLSAGYAGMLTPSFYLAGEIFGGDSWNLKDVKGATPGVRSSWSYGLDLIPGYMITDYVLAYLRVGVVRTRFSDQGNSSTGWQVGVGGQTNLWDNWDLRSEYIYSNYSSLSGLGKPNANQFNVGLVYKFV